MQTTLILDDQLLMEAACYAPTHNLSASYTGVGTPYLVMNYELFIDWLKKEFTWLIGSVIIKFWGLINFESMSF